MSICCYSFLLCIWVEVACLFSSTLTYDCHDYCLVFFSGLVMWWLFYFSWKPLLNELYWCWTIFTFIFGKNENKWNINNNIRGALLDHNFIRSQTLEVQTKRLSWFPLIVNLILGFLFNFIRTLFSFSYSIRFTIATRILFTFLLGLDLLSL